MAKPGYELWGESIHELGVLILVFVPLDVMVELTRSERTIDMKHWVTVMGFGLFGFALVIGGVESRSKEIAGPYS